jgi:hypothetical protein
MNYYSIIYFTAAPRTTAPPLPPPIDYTDNDPTGGGYELSNTSALRAMHSTPPTPPSHPPPQQPNYENLHNRGGGAGGSIMSKLAKHHTNMVGGAAAGTYRGGSVFAAKPHRFAHVTFVRPTKCAHCNSLLVGVLRQGR